MTYLPALPTPSKRLADAPCAGMAPLFDTTNYHDPNAKTALRVCASCSLRVECYEDLRPDENNYSGICAGLIWREGRATKPPTPTRKTRARPTETYLPCDSCGAPRPFAQPCPACAPPPRPTIPQRLLPRHPTTAHTE